MSAEQDDGNDNKETSESTETSEKDDDDKEMDFNIFAVNFKEN